MDANHQALDERKRFFYVTDKGEWTARLTRKELLAQIKAGIINMKTPVWDDVRAAGMDSRHFPAWVALGFARKPSSSNNPFEWEPDDDLRPYDAE
jgi:hypothetical protein